MQISKAVQMLTALKAPHKLEGSTIKVIPGPVSVEITLESFRMWGKDQIVALAGDLAQLAGKR